MEAGRDLGSRRLEWLDTPFTLEQVRVLKQRFQELVDARLALGECPPCHLLTHPSGLVIFTGICPEHGSELADLNGGGNHCATCWRRYQVWRDEAKRLKDAAEDLALQSFGGLVATVEALPSPAPSEAATPAEGG